MLTGCPNAALPRPQVPGSSTSLTGGAGIAIGDVGGLFLHYFSLVVLEAVSPWSLSWHRVGKKYRFGEKRVH